MSSSKSWIIDSIKHRLGLTIVIAVAALGTAVITGNSLVVVIVAIMTAIVFGAIMVKRKAPSGGEGQNERARGEAYSVSYGWKVDRQPDLGEISQVLNHGRFALTQESQSPSQIVLKGGSQFWSRLLGGYFVDPRRLPIQVQLTTTCVANNRKLTVELEVRDRFGIAVRDEALKDRFALAAGNIRETIAGQLEAFGGVEIDSPLHLN